MLKTLLDDANNETRKNSRKAFYRYRELYPTQANKMYACLPGYVKKTIEGELADDGETSSYSKSVKSSQKFSKKAAMNCAKRQYSQESIQNSVTYTENSNATSTGHSNM